MTYGSWDVRGLQFGLAGGSNIALGPFGVNFGSVGEVIGVSVLATSTAVAVPTGSNGVWIVPPAANTTQLWYLSNVADTVGTPISPSGPSAWFGFDTTTPAVPSNIYLKAGTTLLVGIQFV